MWSLIFSKDGFYGMVVVALLICFGVYTHHERTIGAQHEAAAVTKVAVAAEAKVTAANAAAQTAETQNAKTYDAAVAALGVPSVGLVCRNTGHSGSPLPEAYTGPGTLPGNQAADGPVGPPYDPSGSILTRGRDADAQIAYLQARIHELEKQMNDSP